MRMNPIYSEQFTSDNKGMSESPHSKPYICMLSGRLSMQSSIRRELLSDVIVLQGGLQMSRLAKVLPWDFYLWWKRCSTTSTYFNNYLSRDREGLSQLYTCRTCWRTLKLCHWDPCWMLTRKMVDDHGG
jgi:hypothetical protein